MLSIFRLEDDKKVEDEETQRKIYEEVKGSLSTKMTAVVKTLIKIQSDEPEAKALVFSTWTGNEKIKYK